MNLGNKEDSSSIKKDFIYAFRATIPIMTGYIALGMGFGILLQETGYGFLWAAFMGATIYGGSMQYVAVDLISQSASLLTVAMVSLFVNVRHLFYGIAMLEKYKATGWRKPYLIFSLTDETFSLLCKPDVSSEIDVKNYYFFASFLNQLYWIIGCALGGLLGANLAIDYTGVEFSMTALFVVIFVEQWESTRDHVPAISGIVISAICLIIFGADSFLPPSMIGITAALLVRRRIANDGSAHDDSDHVENSTTRQADEIAVGDSLLFIRGLDTRWRAMRRQLMLAMHTASSTLMGCMRYVHTRDVNSNCDSIRCRKAGAMHG